MFVIRGLSTGFSSESLVSQLFGSSSICDPIRLVNGSNFAEMNLGHIPTRSGGQSDSSQAAAVRQTDRRLTLLVLNYIYSTN